MELIPLKNGKLLTVRPAMPEDAEELIALSKIFGGETDFLLTDENGWQVSVEDEAEYIQSIVIDPRRCLMVAVIDGAIVGDFGVNPMGRANGRGAHNATFGVAIRKSCWHLGIGAIFMTLAIDFAREAGYRKLALEVRFDNERAIALYKRFGFEQVGRRKEQMCVRGQYFDELIMERML